jgi:c-di-GMP-binding flagellar brake protein YcgR
MQSIAGSERRDFPRKRVEVTVSLSCADEVATSHTFAVCDISLSGMAIHSATLMPRVGDNLCLCFSAERQRCGQDHVIEATVVRLHQEVVGLRFDSVGIHVLKDIQRLLRNGRLF